MSRLRQPFRSVREAARVARIVAAAMLLALAPLSARAAGPPCPVCVHPSFGPIARAIPTRDLAKFAAVGDFNNDGIPDLAVDDNDLLIYLGTGGGSYAAAALVPLKNPDPRSIVTGDFDRDGNQDLAVAASGVLFVLLGDGTGAFPRLREGPFPPISGIERMSVGDFDGDGNLDLAAVDYYSNRLAILHGVGDGSFSIAQTLIVGDDSYPFSHLVPRTADLDGDGIDDLAVASAGGSQVSIILGRRGSELSVSYAPPFPQVGGDLWIGDFDGDHVPDLAVETVETPSSGLHSITVLKGSGDGTFRTINSFTAGYLILWTIGDFTGDGTLDIALYKNFDFDTGTYGLLVYPGVGGGMFGLPVGTLTTGFAPTMLVAADVNSDGFSDLLVPNQAGETVTVLLGSGNGAFEEAPRFLANVLSIQDVVSADFNGDGIPDVAVGAFIYGQVSVLLGDGKGGFQAPKVSATTSADGGLVAGDFNGDGKPDVAVVSGFEEIYVFLGVGDGSLQPPIQTAKARGPARLAVGDFNRDGKLDLLVQISSSGELVLYAGRGDGTFAAPVTIATIYATSLAVADVNGDGKLDVLLAVPDAPPPPTLRVLLGQGDGTFRAPVLSPLDDTVAALGIGDFNEDRKLDIVVVSPSSGQLSILLGDGTGSFGSPAIIEARGYPRGLTVGDSNGDGHLDVVLSGQDENVTVLAGTGDGRLGPRAVFSLPGRAVQSVIADFDGDGKPDLAVGCISSDGPSDFVASLRNTSCEPRHLVISTNPSACSPPGPPFSTQPILRVLDDGDNLIVCDPGTVSAALVPGMGTAGAALVGMTSVPAIAGEASFSDLSIDRSGSGYVLQFEHPQAGRTRSRRPITIGTAPPVSIEGPSEICDECMYRATAGFDTYVWSVDGAFVGTQSAITINAGEVGRGAHTLMVLTTRAGCSSAASLPVRVKLHRPPSRHQTLRVPPRRAT